MATKVEITPARLCDVWAMERLRPEDAAEVMASGGYSPVEAIIDSWAHSRETYTIRFNGQPAGMFGVAIHPAGTTLAPIGVAWLLTTPVVDKYPVTFFRESKRVVKEFASRYGLLMNFVDARYTRALLWAERLGFHVHSPIPFGKGGEPFRMITYGG